MSQRDGPPASRWSRLFLKCMACLMCEPDYNEWQQVWDGRDDLHHNRPPESQGRYVGHSCRFDLTNYPLRPVLVVTTAKV